MLKLHGDTRSKFRLVMIDDSRGRNKFRQTEKILQGCGELSESRWALSGQARGQRFTSLLRRMLVRVYAGLNGQGNVGIRETISCVLDAIDRIKRGKAMGL